MGNFQEIIDRAKAGTLTSEDVQSLTAAIQSGQVMLATGQQAVAIAGNAAESIIMTGSNNNVNRIYQGFNVEDIKELLKILQELEIANISSPASLRENAQLEKITLDARSIDFINSRLEILEELQKSRQLSEEQADELIELKHKVEAANELDQKLREIEIIAEKILDQSIVALTLKIQDLKQKSEQELLEIIEGVDLERKTACFEKQRELVRRFQTNLSFGKQGSAWLNSNIPEFTKIISKYAIDQFIEIQKTASEDEIDDFYFSIQQFLERIGHCLTWGRYSVLDSFDILLVFDPKIYESSFSFFKQTIIPSHLPTEVRKQLEDHVNYLIRRLPLYPRQ